MTGQEFYRLILSGQIPAPETQSYARRRKVPYIALAIKVTQRMFRERLESLEISQWRKCRYHPIRPAKLPPNFLRDRYWLVNSAGPVWDNAVRAYEEER